jgi:hypothetical protein
MGSLSSIHHGHITGKPYEHSSSGRISGSNERCPVSGSGDRGRICGTRETDKSGTLHGSDKGRGGTLHGGEQQSLEDAALSEISGLIAQLGSLSGQAQGLPLTPPTLPGLPQGSGYQPQALDYSFGDD